MKRLKSLSCVFALAFVAAACAETDPGITTSVKSSFAADDTVKAYQIDVDTREGVVTLSGNLPSEAARQRAVALARETDGVRNVVDNLTVGAGSAALPGEYDTSPAAPDAEDEARDQAGDAGDATGDAAREAGRHGEGRDPRRRSGDGRRRLDRGREDQAARGPLRQRPED